MTTVISDAMPRPTPRPAPVVAGPDPGLIGWAERGLLPDVLVRMGIRRLLHQRLRDEQVADVEAEARNGQQRWQQWSTGPLAVETEAANAQHYEVPPSLFLAALGPRLKYSSCYYAPGDTLAQAEERMLALTCERAGLQDGQDILELGCGWGSLSLWMAEKYPRARITAVSNSHSQRQFITDRAKERNLGNLTVITADLRTFAIDQTWDRVVSVECFEHLRNHAELFRRIAGWLRPDGTLFVHVFTHRSASYEFADQAATDWMSRHFFTGGIMPADTLFWRYQDHLALSEHWRVNGRHYGQTAEHWLQNIDRNRAQAEAALRADGLDATATKLQINRWRIFFMACAELWNFRGGNEWFVSHYRFTKRAGV